ncbi:hypothetical protein AUTU_38270 [Aureibacter tunicatorum]|nr:hypothetical protein AUTU_38270 [Aureibacter tunicatorum]
MFFILIASFLFTWNKNFQAPTGLSESLSTKESGIPSIPSDKGVFSRADFATEYQNMPADENHQRAMDEYYENRAFHGAPPSIPHPVEDDRDMGKSCMKCHDNGGFVPKYKAYAPVTPHPEMSNCKQCHVTQETTSLFKHNNFYKKKTPKVGENNALPGSPPVIPHQIQLRENCLSCHSGPSAPKEIRVSHPERSNCLQCHVVNDKGIIDIGTFSR